MSDRYNVINNEEPHGQSVAENGTPCTARYCVARLNRLSQDNEKLEARLKLLLDYTKYFTQQINRSIMTENQILTVKLDGINKLLKDLLDEIVDEHCTAILENNDDSNIIEAQLALIKKILDEVKKI